MQKCVAGCIKIRDKLFELYNPIEEFHYQYTLKFYFNCVFNIITAGCFCQYSGIYGIQKMVK